MWLLGADGHAHRHCCLHSSYLCGWSCSITSQTDSCQSALALVTRSYVRFLEDIPSYSINFDEHDPFVRTPVAPQTQKRSRTLLILSIIGFTFLIIGAGTPWFASKSYPRDDNGLHHGMKCNTDSIVGLGKLYTKYECNDGHDVVTKSITLISCEDSEDETCVDFRETSIVPLSLILFAVLTGWVSVMTSALLHENWGDKVVMIHLFICSSLITTWSAWGELFFVIFFHFLFSWNFSVRNQRNYLIFSLNFFCNS